MIQVPGLEAQLGTVFLILPVIGLPVSPVGITEHATGCAVLPGEFSFFLTVRVPDPDSLVIMSVSKLTGQHRVFSMVIHRDQVSTKTFGYVLRALKVITVPRQYVGVSTVLQTCLKKLRGTTLPCRQKRAATPPA